MRNRSSIDAVIQAVRTEQRRHPRRSVNIRVRVFWQGESAELVEAPGLVRDISVNGFGIEIAHYLPEGRLLSVETTAGALQGVVRHVHQVSGGYATGMEILLASDGSDHQRSLRNLETVIREAKESR